MFRKFLLIGYVVSIFAALMINHQDTIISAVEFISLSYVHLIFILLNTAINIVLILVDFVFEFVMIVTFALIQILFIILEPLLCMIKYVIEL